MVKENKRLTILLLAAVILLLIPFIAMQFTQEVKWSPFDFLVMGTLLLGTVLICEFVLRKIRSFQYRLVLCVAILAAFFLIWAELAVGIFGTPFAGS